MAKRHLDEIDRNRLTQPSDRYMFEALPDRLMDNEEEGPLPSVEEMIRHAAAHLSLPRG
ncbi:MAG: hypothetical protein P0Y55_14155 [Candidatus Cohnella colombiensis]|uniref:Uncharacterized protein n=1 Tax=Candidatus Cohnella colombiensis TaxID=3121368 RepID=A0AA95EVJ8_9BACL|nr:MAG: hypothetical protein P0Y55_14155 [Cohnella sp.]